MRITRNQASALRRSARKRANAGNATTNPGRDPPSDSGTPRGVHPFLGPAIRGCRWRATPGYPLATLRVASSWRAATVDTLQRDRDEGRKMSKLPG